MKKYFIILFSVLFMVLNSAAMAASISERVEMAERRIEQGVRSGALTQHEGHRLREEFFLIRRDENQARADGHLDRRERERLNDELDRLERRIAHLEHNDGYRDGRRGEGRGDERGEDRGERRRY